MSDETTLEVQEPGVVPTLDIAKLEAILAKKAGEIPGQLDALANDELAMLATLETQTKARATVLKAISIEAGHREADEGLGDGEIQGASEANLGDREKYATMRASDVDATKLLTPCLTLDGWVLPLPKAEG